jgi:roadblock/LC7 domain-containing protein
MRLELCFANTLMISSDSDIFGAVEGSTTTPVLGLIYRFTAKVYSEK